MRNPFSRVARSDAARPSLRERLAATKEKYGRTLRVHRALNAPAPVATPPVDRVALVNYASWLFMERRLVCSELYPQMGVQADRFVLALDAAEKFHFPTGGSFPSAPTNPHTASSRAVAVLDAVGVDWRSDLSASDVLDPASRQDDGSRPPLPYGWPAVDAALVTACGDLQRIDAAIKAVLPDDGRNAMDVPGYDVLDEERGAVLSTMARESARSLTGLQAKARAMMSPAVQDDYRSIADLAQSIATDLLGGPAALIEPRPDPIFSLIEEARRLLAVSREAFKLPQPVDTIDPPPEQGVAQNALWGHCQDRLLKTVPTTARGCRALAQFILDFRAEQGLSLDDDGSLIVAGLIAASPML